MSIRMLLTCLLLAFGSAPAAEEPVPAEQYAKALVTLSLKANVEIQKVIHWGDGGSIGVILKGGENTEFNFCIDGRLNVFDDNAKSSGDLYVGATVPDDKGAQLAPIGSKKDIAIRIVLKEWLARYYSDAEQAIIKSNNLVKNTEQDDRGRAALKILDILAEHTPVVSKKKK